MENRKRKELEIPKEIESYLKFFKSIKHMLPKTDISFKEKEESLFEKLGTPDQRISESNRKTMNDIYEKFKKEKLESEKSNKRHMNINYGFSLLNIIIISIPFFIKNHESKTVYRNESRIDSIFQIMNKVNDKLKNQEQNIENNEAYNHYLESQILFLKDSLNVNKKKKP